MDCSDLTIIIPTLNEAGNIGRLVRTLSSSYPGVHIIVSDDGSADGTKREAMGHSGRVNVIFLDRRRRAVHGLTASVIDAVKLARTSYVVVMDADLQHPPEVVGRLYMKLLGGADVAVAVRTRVNGWGAYRRVLSAGITAFSVLAFTVRRRPTVSDMMSGFFGARRDVLTMVINEHGDGFVMTGYKVLLDALRMFDRDVAIAEVPYSTFHPRLHGRSKLKPSHMFDTLRSVLR